MFGAFSLEHIARKIERRQRPDGKKYIRGWTEGIFSYLLAFGEECSKHDSAGNTKLLVAEVCFQH